MKTDAAELCETALGVLERRGLAERMESKDGCHSIHGLSRGALRLATHVTALRCRACGRQIAVHPDEVRFWLGAPCPVGACNGTLAAADKDVQENFYAGLYRSGDIRRLFTAEHTGLLTRSEREAVEQSFKREDDPGTGERRFPWDLNLLSCTPTLEMGIDIGSLSSTIQCSVPPAQSNYLQRVGRAGRRNGNALTVTVAGGSPHDQYFYASPMLMMAGSVTPPGIFLNASAVLERQLTAYCMDCWTAEDESGRGVPAKIRDVLSTVFRVESKKLDEAAAAKLFPYNFLRWVESQTTDILQRFTAMFPNMENEVKEYLSAFLKGGGLDRPPFKNRLVDALQREAEEVNSNQNRLRRMRADMRRMEGMPQDDSIRAAMKELALEIRALDSMNKAGAARDTLQFMADESLLPNYAFPEPGVTLHSVVFRKKCTDSGQAPATGEAADGSDYEEKPFDYQRSAAAALRELAPGSSFYAGKRKVTITKVDLKTSHVEAWRLCPDCPHIEPEGATPPGSPCPRCGSEMFGDQGQVRELLKTSQVFATTPDADSRVDDSVENRTPEFYVTQLLMDYDRAMPAPALCLDSTETVFAYAYLKKASFREINFGQASDADPLAVAGKILPRQGFKVCRHCGCVMTARPRHEWGCPSRNPGAAPEVHECLYFYRSFDSEAIKILLPFSDGEKSAKLESFVAALNMGLRLKFGGTLQHLQTMLSSEPDSHGGGLRRQHLVIFDSVPGGTGYLKQLMQGATLIDVLALALDRMEQCGCEDAVDNDGCYKCLRAYRNSGRSSFISKHSAIDMLRPIVRNRDRLKPAGGTDDIVITSLFDSELELRFIEALRRMHTRTRPVDIQHELVHGKTGFLLRIGGRSWKIEQQVELGPEQDVAVPSRADFVFYPVHATDGLRPVVVFTDGWTWHKGRIGLDMAQRSAISASGKFLVWSLSWEDVAHVFDAAVTDAVPADVPEYCEPVLGPANAGKAAILLDNLVKNCPEDKPAARAGNRNALAMLLDYLASPDEHGHEALARTCAMLFACFPGMPMNAYRTEVEKLPAAVAEWALPANAARAALVKDGPFSLHAALAKEGRSFSASVVLGLDDSDDAPFTEDVLHKSWRGMLRAMNLFQFLPSFLALAATGSEADYGLLHRPECGAGRDDGKESLPGEWEEALELAAGPEEQDLLRIWFRNGIELPQVGWEVEEGGSVLGELEIAWPDCRAGFFTPGHEAEAAAIAALGWTLAPLEKALESPEIAASMLGA